MEIILEMLRGLERAGGALSDLDGLFGRRVHPHTGGTVFFGESAESADRDLFFGFEPI